MAKSEMNFLAVGAEWTAAPSAPSIASIPSTLPSPSPLPSSSSPSSVPLAKPTVATQRMLIVDQSGQLGGAELALLPLLEAWRGRCQLVLLADGPFRERVERVGVPVTVLTEPRVLAIRKSRSALGAVMAVGAIFRQVKALAARAADVDVIYLNSQKALVLGAIAGAIAKKPVVWHAHDIMSRKHFGRLQLAIVRTIARRYVDQVIANSAASAASIQALTGCDLSSITVLHNGISAAPFESAPTTERAEVRRSLGLPDSVFAAGLFGRLTHWKGIHVVLDAIAMLPSVHLVIIGSAMFGEQEYESMLKRKVEALKLGDRVHFAGFRDDIPTLMKAVDAVLHAAIAPEPFGRVIVEGMLARRPVVATAAGGVLEIIEHRKNGLLVPPNDPYAIADALASLNSSTAWAERLGEQAFSMAVDRFSVDRYVDAVSTVLNGAHTTIESPARRTQNLSRNREA